MLYRADGLRACLVDEEGTKPPCGTASGNQDLPASQSGPIVD